MNSIKYIVGSVLISVMMGCNTVPETSSVTNQCKDARPEICTMIYQPVCGLDSKGDFNTYSSGCNACSHLEVVGYDDEACEDTNNMREY